MRILTLSAIALLCLYTYFPTKEDGVQIDDVKIKISAPGRKAPEILPKRSIENIVLEETKVENDSDFSPEASASEADVVSTEENLAEVTHVEEAPESDQEKAWQDELGQKLSSLEPEYGEEMFNAYVNEKNGFQSSLDELIRANQKNQDLEFLISELEIKHEDRVKEIFGRHYEEIKARETEFLESESP